MPDVKTVDGILMKRACEFADPRAIDADCTKMADQIKNVPREFIVNIDKSCFADSVDARPERIVVSLRREEIERHFRLLLIE
jgi:hypothetical protein